MRDLRKEYELAKKEYAKIGVDTDKALERLANVRISMHCWQGDDVRGFLFNSDLSGGIQTTGNYPGRARNVKELKEDITEVLKLVPGKFNLNLHAIYADTDEKIDLDQIEPKHFAKWVEFAKEHNIGLDFNPTCFSHPMASSGFTLSSADDKVRNFWIEHCKRSRKIGEYFGKELGIPCVTNIWIPDGMKDIPYDRLSPRKRLEDSLDKILEEKIDPKYNIDSVESKVFGIGLESYTVGSNEFYLGYATKNQTALTLDSGHFHPTEYISDKISSVLLYVPHLLLHVSRPVRWDSDHVVIFDDELNEIARSLVRSNLIEKTSIGLDYFDASINRIAAWVVGIRSTQKALLKAMLEPVDTINELEKDMKYTDRMVLTEEMKSMPFGVVYDYYCFINNIPVGSEYLSEIKDYENKVLSKRG
ncbi:MAG: L-rhamnose isomerase [Mollicutes bacterium]|nr:L-rhamnose isomerase [Mollicutes bacterium]MDD7264366.1 L-rhamnose isomerase [bacterium]MDY4979696.1 L-rhamnose isomerase [Candidatus Onthovivens sp.]